MTPKQEYEAILVQWNKGLEESSRKTRIRAVIIGLVIMLATLLYNVTNPPELLYYWLAELVGGAFVWMATGPGRATWLSRDAYYTISGSTDAKGEHRCIWCGARGIWRQGEYQGNSTYCRCSKCRQNLWVE